MAQTVTIDNADDSNNKDNGITDLMNKNSDCIGWLRINGTKIDYPIMQTKENPQFYIRRDFNKQYSYLGTPFMDPTFWLTLTDELMTRQMQTA